MFQLVEIGDRLPRKSQIGKEGRIGEVRVWIIRATCPCNQGPLLNPWHSRRTVYEARWIKSVDPAGWATHFTTSPAFGLAAIPALASWWPATSCLPFRRWASLRRRLSWSGPMDVDQWTSGSPQKLKRLTNQNSWGFYPRFAELIGLLGFTRLLGA